MLNLLALHFPDEKRKYIRMNLDNAVPVALKSMFSKVVYRSFFMKNFSLSGAWVEYPYTYNEDIEHTLLPVLIHENHKKYHLYFNILNYKELAKDLQNISCAVDHNFWLELPCEVKRYEKRNSSFGLGLKFL